MNQVKGFILSLVIVIIVFVIVAFSAGALAGLAGVWKKPIIGGVAAFGVVITGYITAPNHKQFAAAFWLVAGAVAAWILAGDSYYPEDHQYAYQLTIIPLLATYVSGALALLLCVTWHRKWHKQHEKRIDKNDAALK
ncbi:hypothetical protein [Colwellia sp. E2M01]|uniref:hypothetical protein n=1 Tax=Colwellia sp. E2M01 TaxID=2841561 RepID=UPI001C095DCF|nr:hypothetical protein [Colwellia sp. E2M01]MBU2871994.1 hypothetical protein [Colwellia sp. E2M01]